MWKKWFLILFNLFAVFQLAAVPVDGSYKLCVDELVSGNHSLFKERHQVVGRHIVYAVKVENENIEQKWVYHALQQLEDVVLHLESKFEFPKTIEIDIVEKDVNAFYDPIGNYTTLPVHLHLKELIKHPKYSWPIFRHEFAHGIFNVNLKTKLRALTPYREAEESRLKWQEIREGLGYYLKSVKSYEKQLKLVLEKSHNLLFVEDSVAEDIDEDLVVLHNSLIHDGEFLYYFKALKRVVPLMRRHLKNSVIEPVTGDEPKEELLKKIRKVQKDIVEIEKLIADYDEFYENFELVYELHDFHNIVRPYEELFADIVGTVTLNNPSAIKETLFFAGSENLEIIKDGKKMKAGDYFHERARSRDYDGPILLDAWDKHSDYTLLVPTGRYLWKYYFSNPLYKDIKADMLEILFKSIGNEVLFYVKKGQFRSGIRGKDKLKVISRINKRLIYEFERLFDKKIKIN